MIYEASIVGCLFVFREVEKESVRWLLHFLLLIAQQPLGRFTSNVAHVNSIPGENF